MVSPREELMVATPERQQTAVKKDVDSRIPERVPLRCAEAIMEFTPEDYVALDRSARNTFHRRPRAMPSRRKAETYRLYRERRASRRS